MSRITICLFTILIAADGLALNNRSAVSVNGSDSNPCTVISPCRSFSAAIAQTTAGGDVIALDSAGYGPFTADRSVNVIAPGGVYAGITVTSGDGVTLNSGGSKVVLRNLAITGVGGMNGINDLAAADLYIQDCTISGFIVGLGSGVLYSSATSYSGGNLVDISHSTFRENTYAVHISPANQFLLETMNIDNSDLVSNYYGVYLDNIGHIQATITRSRLTHNYTDGLYQTNSTSGNSTIAEIESSIIAGNLYDGIVADDAGGFSFVRLSNSMVALNGGTGVRPINGGGIYSRGNNTVQDNGTDGTFTSTFAAK